MSKKWIVALVVSLALVVALATAVMAQSTTPTTPTTPTPGQGLLGKLGRGGLLGGRMFGGGGWTEYDSLAKALNLTPTQLFEQLHNGKTLAEIATAQGVDLQKLQDAAQATRLDAMKQSIADAVKAGKLTQEQADWMLKGMENGWGFGGRGGHGGRGGFGPGTTPNTTPKGGSFAPAAPRGSLHG